MLSQTALEKSIIPVDWPAPRGVKAVYTSRLGGVSDGVYAGFNLAQHVGDRPASVEQNRCILESYLQSSEATTPQIRWLNQTHSNHCIAWNNNRKNKDDVPSADAIFSSEKGQACCVMTADCLPILLTNQQGSWVAACHAGWRGLLDGVIENTLANYPGETSELIAWTGPAISLRYFEVGAEVRAAFIEKQSSFGKFFHAQPEDKFLFDLAGLAEYLLSRFSVAVYRSGLCSFADAELFYSYRRDGQTGRMASLIWIEQQA